MRVFIPDDSQFPEAFFETLRTLALVSQATSTVERVADAILTCCSSCNSNNSSRAHAAAQGRWAAAWP